MNMLIDIESDVDQRGEKNSVLFPTWKIWGPSTLVEVSSRRQRGKGGDRD